MGNYSCRRENFLVGWEIDVAQLVFQGKSNKEIAIEVLDADPKDRNDLLKKVKRVKRLTESKKFEEYYKSLIKEWTIHNVGKALNKLSEQIDSNQPWLANKASNDILQRAPKTLIGDDSENTVVVKVEGMPELGVPEE